MYCIEPQLDRDYILSRLSEEQIMEKYTGLSVQYRAKFCSPLRKDRNPTCRFHIGKSGKLYLKDYSGAFWGDCFSLVMHLNCLNPLDRKSFYEALKIIAFDFGLTKHSPIVQKQTIAEALAKAPAAIDIKIREWENVDKEYWWDKFHLSKKVLKRYNVYPVAVAWLNGDIVYNHRDTDTCYAYRMAKGEYKLYFPLRGKDKARFMGNSHSLQGYTQLPESGDLLIITKSMKDVMVLSALGIFAVAYQAESVVPDPITIAILKNRFQTIYTLYDFDYAGIRTANKIKRVYGILPLMLTNGRFRSPDYRGKDVAECVSRFGWDNVVSKLINFLTNHYSGKNLFITPLVYEPGSLMDVPF